MSGTEGCEGGCPERREPPRMSRALAPSLGDEAAQQGAGGGATGARGRRGGTDAWPRSRRERKEAGCRRNIGPWSQRRGPRQGGFLASSDSQGSGRAGGPTLGLPGGQGDREQLASEVPTGLEFSSGTNWRMDGLFSDGRGRMRHKGGVDPRERAGCRGFPGSLVVRSLLVHVGGADSIPDPGRPHMLRGS